jgi:excisionase family DNA binding protein
VKAAEVRANKNGDCAAEAMPQQALVDKCELATHLSVSRTLIDRLVTERRIPFVRIGRCLRFELGAVLQALKNESR